MNPPSELLARLSAKKHNKPPLKLHCFPSIVTSIPSVAKVFKSLIDGSRIQSIPYLSIIGCTAQATKLMLLRVDQNLGGMFPNVKRIIPNLSVLV